MVLNILCNAGIQGERLPRDARKGELGEMYPGGKGVEEEGESESGARQTIAEGDGKVARERQQE